MPELRQRRPEDSIEDLLEYERRLNASEWPVFMRVPHETIDKFYREKKLALSGYEFIPNEFIILKSATGGSQSALARWFRGRFRCSR